MAPEYGLNPNQRTVTPRGWAFGISEVPVYQRLLGVRNVDNHLVADDLQEYVNGLYDGNISEEHSAKVREDLKNSVNDDEILGFVEKAFDEIDAAIKDWAPRDSVETSSPHVDGFH